MERSLFGVDYSGARPHLACLKSNGVDVALRYIAPDTPSFAFKRLTRNEKDRIFAAGLGLVVVWETGATRALSGRTGGKWDAQLAQEQLRQLGLRDLPVYFAADWDVKPSQQPAVNDYLRGAAETLGRARVGLYGGYWPVKRAFDAKVISFGWQTYAWSGGNVDRRAQVFQYSNSHSLCSGSVDYNHVAPHAAIAGPGGVAPKPKPEKFLTDRERFICNRRCYHRRLHMKAKRGSKQWVVNLGWARWYKARIRAQMRLIQLLARREKQGWEKRHRGLRYQVLAKYWTGKAC